MPRNAQRFALAALAMLWGLHVALAAGDATPMAAELRSLEQKWAHVTYEVKDSSEQDRQMRVLAAEAAQIAARYPGRAEPLIWHGIILSSEAKYAGMMSAISFAKDARSMFEHAGRIDFRAVDGAVPTSLGALYFMVPGFPLGFGDNDKARRYLEQGIQISPNGLDAAHFYGDFLYAQGEYQKAAGVLKHALAVPADRQRPVWDAGRRSEIRAVLAKAEQRLAAGG